MEKEEISEEKIKEYVRGWKKKQKKKEAARRKRTRHARKKAEAIAEMAFESFEAEKVWIIGSLAREEMRENSDIDMVISGISDLSPEEFWSLLKKADKLASPFRVDIIPAEDASPALKKRIEREGVRLDEK